MNENKINENENDYQNEIAMYLNDGGMSRGFSTVRWASTWVTAVGNF
jgi:hypothetical protein